VRDPEGETLGEMPRVETLGERPRVGGDLRCDAEI
jgi:hypothetical protein